MDQTAKADGGKTQPGLLQKDMAAAMLIVQRVLDYGMQKYERMSWRKVAIARWDEAVRRHQQAIDLGEELDDESGLPHRAHIIAGHIIILQLTYGVPGIDLRKVCEFKEPPQDHKKTESEWKPYKSKYNYVGMTIDLRVHIPSAGETKEYYGVRLFNGWSPPDVAHLAWFIKEWRVSNGQDQSS